MKVNGTVMNIEENMSLHDFLTEHGYNIERVAVERNGEIVPKSSYKETLLNDEDTLEIVQFVGGG